MILLMPKNIYTSINFTAGTTGIFEGRFVDSSAELKCIGETQANIHSKMINKPLNSHVTAIMFKFGNKKHSSLGAITIRMPVGELQFADIEAEVVPVDITILLWLNIIAKFEMILGFDKDFIHTTCDGWLVPMVRKLGHAYIAWALSILYMISSCIVYTATFIILK